MASHLTNITLKAKKTLQAFPAIIAILVARTVLDVISLDDVNPHGCTEYSRADYGQPENKIRLNCEHKNNSQDPNHKKNVHYRFEWLELGFL